MAVTIFSPNPAPTTAAYPTLLVADHRSSGAFNRAPSRNPSRPTKSVAHSIALTRGRNPGVPLSMRPVPAPATTLPARPRSGWSCGAAVQPQMYVLPIRRIPGLTPAHVGDQPTADAESIRRCIRVERDPSPRRPRASTSPATVSRSRSRTAYPGSSRRKAKERPAGVRRWPTTTQNGSSTPTSTAKAELVRSDGARQIKGHFILHMELMTTAIKCLNLLLKRNLMVTILPHTNLRGLPKLRRKRWQHGGSWLLLVTLTSLEA
nr:uncharacterized protein LOC127325599 isoform X6 [Lolium perenne]XP_051208373.1 uncharacterized protein LOC127325599 isoform X6 [Lolium perenne]